MIESLQQWYLGQHISRGDNIVCYRLDERGGNTVLLIDNAPAPIVRSFVLKNRLVRYFVFVSRWRQMTSMLDLRNLRRPFV